jgi:hypothetical protein
VLWVLRSGKTLRKGSAGTKKPALERGRTCDKVSGSGEESKESLRLSAMNDPRLRCRRHQVVSKIIHN